MSKLYVFGIGGTGARVIKSLTMLLASGIEAGSFEIVPIIIDPDKAGGDLNRTVKLLRDYQQIQSELKDFDHNHFFKTNISSLSEVVTRQGGNANVIDGFRFELNGVQNERFKDFIDFGNLDSNNKNLTSLLFSNDNLNSDLEVGFKGNPNIGSVVLNQFTKSEAFEAFARNFEQGDRVFIISSIFGGTGAAGFPLILKNIREGFVNGQFYNFLKNAPIGAITVQPYFKVSNDENSEIDSSGFISKTKAALHYYFKNVTGNSSVNALYYIGDSASNEYENVEGGTEQKNDAHFVEVASALSIIDFATTDNSLIQTSNGKANNPNYKEFGIQNLTDRITFNDLCNDTTDILRNKLTEYFYFNLFLKDKIRNELSHPFAVAYNNKIDKNFFDQVFFKTLLNFNKSFRIWLGELQRNKISFTPFNIEPVMNDSRDILDFEAKTTSIFTLVNGVNEKKGLFAIFNKNNYELFIANLNAAAENVGETSINKRFMGVFSQATKKSVQQKLF